MAPGPLSILAPLFGLKASKKYEKLQTEDPERRKQEATQDEINRLNCKIDKLVTSMENEELDVVSDMEDACLVCCKARAVMQVSPCGHQSQCRLCFVHNIREAVASKNLPLRCLVCNLRIAKVKNNNNNYNNNNRIYMGGSSQKDASRMALHVVKGEGTGPGATTHRMLPTSVSGYSICGDSLQGNDDVTSQSYASMKAGRATKAGAGAALASSSSSFSMSSVFSSISSSSIESQQSSAASVQSCGQKSTNSRSSWFSLGTASLSSFHVGNLADSHLLNRQPSAHSLSSRGKMRTSQSSSSICNNFSSSNLSPSPSGTSIKSWACPASASSTPSAPANEAKKVIQGRGGGTLYRDPGLSRSEHGFASSSSSRGAFSKSPSAGSLSPKSIDQRIRAMQAHLLATPPPTKGPPAQGQEAQCAVDSKTMEGVGQGQVAHGDDPPMNENGINNQRSSKSATKHSDAAKKSSRMSGIGGQGAAKAHIRRFSGSGAGKDQAGFCGRARYNKSSDQVETTFSSMTTIAEEEHEFHGFSSSFENEDSDDGCDDDMRALT